MQIGYSRVSTTDQSLDLQNDDLKKAGCEKIFSDIASGAKSERDGLGEALNFARKGDTIVVWKLDRLGRSLRHLIETVQVLQKRGIGFRSLREQIDTTSAGGKLIFHVFGALAEFERELIRERTKAGLESARARGRVGGRPPIMTVQKIKMAEALYREKSSTPAEICKALGISKATLYRHLKEAPRV